MGTMYNRMKPFVAVIFLQVGFAGMDILAKTAFNKGMSNYVFVAYRYAVATIVMAPFAFFLEKSLPLYLSYRYCVSSKNTTEHDVYFQQNSKAKDDILNLRENSGPELTRASHRQQPILFGNERNNSNISCNLFFLGMKETTATLAVALINVVPGITFVMACILRIEKIKIKSFNKIVGTLTTLVGLGAMLMTLVKGPSIELHSKTRSIGDTTSSDISLQNTIKGSVMVLVGCLSSAGFIILQVITLKTYLVVWGTGNDYKSKDSFVELKNASPIKEMIDRSQNKDDLSTNKIMILSAPDAGTSTTEKQEFD